ncbi:MAG: glycoside hydrolase family 32 protein [Paludibacteraceae bacterium]|nr:glycoside hydrolase family 32 protein [Paludibacteraceae bacterium]
MNRLYPILFLVVAALTACTTPVPDKEPDKPVQEDTTTQVEPGSVSPTTRPDLYRPQVHYTPVCNWSNDPNGLFYKDGVWHLYYQFNPHGIECDFGGMSWGHASSTDLMHWQEKSPVLYPDGMGAMYSGCSVVDHDNKAGFGPGAVLAYYTASGEKQLICLAISTDGGETFWKYEHNPIVPSTGLNNFRDPKVVYDAKRGRWTMMVARGWDLGAEIWHSYNLMQWEFDGIFRVNIERCNLSQWECCDLMYFEQADKWVAVVSINPNGYITGSSMMYFVGQFDGVTFTPDDDEYPRWLDYGADCYAGVSWDNAPDNRKVIIAWMNNWDYAPACPPTAWKGAYTMPRELSLRWKGSHWVLCSEPVKELDAIAGTWQQTAAVTENIGGDYADAWEAQVTLSLNSDATITLANKQGNQYVITVDSRQRRIYCNRGGKTGEFTFSALFAVPSMSAPIEGDEQYITLDIIVDQSSVELFAGEGSTCITNNVYPCSIYRNMYVDGEVIDIKVRTLETIWKP